MKKLALLSAPFLIMSPASALEIQSIITDSVQLTVEGPAVQSTRIGTNYAVSGTNVSVETLGGINTTSCSSTGAASITAGSYDINTDGQSFTFSESATIGDTVVAAQTTLTTNGRFATPNLYGETITSVGGTSGTLAGTLSGTSIPTITAGGPGSTAIGQRTIQLSVFQ